MTTSIYAWSTDAASNATADSAINWSEFQAPDTVNNSARQMMGRVAEVLKDIAPTRTSAGSGNAYTVSTASNIASLVDGTIVYFYADKTNTGSSTLAVNSFGAKPLRARTGTALTGNEILVGTVVGAYYRLAGDEWIITNSGYHTNILVPGLLASNLVTMRVGSILAWPTSTVPTGWLECDGSAVSRTTYSQLFAALGTTYGAGDGSTTFNLPDYRGQFLRGHANGSSNDPDRASRTDRGDGTTGDAVGTKQAADTGTHAHGPGTLAGTTNTTGDHQHTNGNVVSLVGLDGGPSSIRIANDSLTGTAGSHNHTVTISSGVTGATGGNETRPRNVYVKYIILALPAAASASTLGVNGLLYTWDTGTADADPGTGKLRLNNATIASATKVFISETGADSAAYGDLIGTWDDSTSTVKGILHFYKVGALSTYAIFSVSGAIVDDGSYRDVTITHIASSGSFASGDQLSVLFHRTGDAGSAGATGAAGPAGAAGPNVGLDYQWNTATSGDPGTGKVLVNNATPSSATALHISETNRLSASQAAFLATWDDSTDPNVKGTVRIVDVSSPGTNFLEYQITGSLTDAGSYDTFPVTYVGGAGTLTNDMQISVAFFRTGNKGSDGVGAGDVTAASSFGTDNVLIRSDGTGKGVQSTGISVSDTTNNVSGTGSIVPASNDGGALGSGTLSYSDLFLASGGVINFNNGNATLTHSAGLLTSNVPISLGTSNALTVGTIELGNASDTTISRVSAGVAAIEGSNIITASRTATETQTGVVELATDAETQTGTDTARAITPANLTAKEATVANWRSNTADRILTTDIAFSAMAEVTLTDAATVAWDMSTGFDFVVTLGGNRTLGNPTNTTVGKKGRIRVVQDGAGGRTLSYSSNIEFAGGSAPTLSTAISAEDVLYYDCISSTRILMSIVKAIA